MPELTQGADRQFQLSTTRLLKLNFLTSNTNLFWIVYSQKLMSS